jgi:hypothetical protein
MRWRVADRNFHAPQSNGIGRVEYQYPLAIPTTTMAMRTDIREPLAAALASDICNSVETGISPSSLRDRRIRALSSTASVWLNANHTIAQHPGPKLAA